MRSIAVAASLLLAGCGYHVAGHADLMPKTIHTIAIPAFGNATTRYRLTDHLAEAVSREFTARTRYQIVSDPSQADAVLNGSVIGYFSYPTIFDPATGRASTVELMVTMSVTVTERTTGKVLYNRPNFYAKQLYELSANSRAFFDESDAALDRLSRDVAQSLVSGILENF